MGGRILAVLVGGMIGTAARLAVAALPTGPGAWPWGTFVANVTGSLLLGYLVVRAAVTSRPSPLLLAMLGTGVLGSYTTFSIFSVETIQLVEDGRPLVALTYVTTSVAVGYLAAVGAMRVAGGRP